jgi:hypothetical protein
MKKALLLIVSLISLFGLQVHADDGMTGDTSSDSEVTYEEGSAENLPESEASLAPAVEEESSVEDTSFDE